MAMDAWEQDQKWVFTLEEKIAETLKRLDRRGEDVRPRLVDTTMQYAPISGGVKRYLRSKSDWLGQHRTGVRHALLVPGKRTRVRGDRTVTVAAPKVPFGAGYRWPMSRKSWSTWLQALNPALIEAGDPYGPGVAAIEAGQNLGVPVIGFCHSDPAYLASLHWGQWAVKPIEKRWGEIFGQFDRVIAPSRFIAGRLREAGVERIVERPLGVDIEAFHPDHGDRDCVRRDLGVRPGERLLVFAGRAAKEKNVDVIISAVEKLGAPYRLLLIGAADGLPIEGGQVISLPFQQDTASIARFLASCDAFVHANDKEPFGLCALEAMASGLPVVCTSSGGVSETVDEAVGVRSASLKVADYASAIEALFEHDIEAMSRAARRRAVTRYGWSTVFEELCMVYAEVSGVRAFVEAGEGTNPTAH
ncbi:MAG: glycosyltransferase [Caulobacterales bacterium]|nr:glycosyltransferase [Caulobacterales bacterium]